MTRPLCLIVSADAASSSDWRRGLEPCGFRPYAVADVEAALGVLGQCRVDALLLDGDDAGARAPVGVRRPVLGAIEALGARTDAPILVVWSETGEARQIDALERGAADTVVRPASPSWVGAKLKRLVAIAGEGTRADALRSRGQGPGARAVGPAGFGSDAGEDDRDGDGRGSEADDRDDVVFGPLRLDARRALATCAGRPLALTAGEFALVALLAGRAGEVVTRETIARTVADTLAAHGHGAGRPALRDTHRGTDMHVCRVRRKLEAVGAADDGVRLATVHGRGYALRIGELSAAA